MNQDEFLEELSKAILELDARKTLAYTRKALDLGLNPFDVIDRGLSKGMKEMGERFARGDVYIPHLVLAADIMNESLKILKPKLLQTKEREKTVTKVLIGTVQGDIHDLGKNLVATMLTASGFDVVDLGRDVPTKTVIEKVKEYKPDVVGLSALMTTTMLEQRKVVDSLKDTGLRNSVKVLVGGAPVSSEWAKEISSDGYAENALEAVKIAKLIVSK